MTPEARVEQTEHGLAASGGGWYVVNAHDVRWAYREGRGAYCDFEGETDFAQVGVNLWVLGPGEATGLYHWETDQEDFLVLDGEATLLVEGQERPLKQWDFFHCPSKTVHMIVGAGTRRCVILGVGAREHDGKPDWGGYVQAEVAARYGVNPHVETPDPKVAYAPVPRRDWTRYREEWLGE